MEDSGVYQRLVQAGMRRTRFSVDIYDDAQQLYNRDPRPGWSAMERELADRHGDEAPTEKTLRSWEKRGVITHESEDQEWALGRGGFTPEDEAILIGLMRGHAENSIKAIERGGHAHQHSWRETLRTARWAVRIVRIAPKLAKPQHTFQVLMLAHNAARGGPDRENVERVLALAPWQDHGRLLRRARAAGVVDWDVAVLNDWQAWVRRESQAQARARTTSRTT